MTNFNSARTIGRCIESILSQSRLKPIELVIVDAASTDGSIDIIKRYEDRGVRLIVVPKIACSAGESMAQSLAVGEFIATTNPDVYVPHDWLEKSYAWWLKGYQVVGGIKINVGDVYNFAWTAFPDSKPWEEERNELGLSTMSIFTPKSVILGLLPPSSIFESRDVELALAAKRNGVKLIIDPNIRVLHDNPLFSARNSFKKSSSYIARHMQILRGSYGKVAFGSESGINLSIKNALSDFLLIDGVKTYYLYKDEVKSTGLDSGLFEFLFMRWIVKLGQVHGLLKGIMVRKQKNVDFRPISVKKN